MSPNTTLTTATPATTTQKPAEIHTASNEKSLKNILECIEDIEIYIILIFAQILLVLSIKIFKMCNKTYTKHNEIVIRKHNRISPQI